METTSIEEQRLLQDELSPGESVLWTGRPEPRVWWHASDWGMTIFAVFWSAFSMFWEAGASGLGPWSKPHTDPSYFMVLWGVPFIVVGQYMLWGRFAYVAWRKRRIIYALTNERLLTIVRPPQPKVITMFLRSVPGISKEIGDDGNGTLKFGETPPLWGSRGSKKSSELYLNVDMPVFQDIDEAADVGAQIQRAIQKIVA